MKRKNYFPMSFIKLRLMWRIANRLPNSQGWEKMDSTSEIAPLGSKHLNIPS